MLYYLLLALGALLLFFYVREKIRAYSVKAVLLKASVSSLFIAVGLYGSYVSAAAGRISLLCPFVLFGLLCGLLGDIWLDLKYVFREKEQPFTYAGFCAFAIGHAFFIAGMLLACRPAGKPLYVLLPLLLGLLMSVGNIAMEKPMKLRFGKLKPVVFLYGIFLFSMVLLAGSLALAQAWQNRSLNLLFAGGVLFAVSDLILSGTYFGTGKERPVDFILNYLSYYAAQFLIASSLLFL